MSALQFKLNAESLQKTEVSLNPSKTTRGFYVIICFFNSTHGIIKIIYIYTLIFSDTYVFEKAWEGKVPWAVAWAWGPIY